jgi:hypothetical protein
MGQVGTKIHTKTNALDKWNEMGGMYRKMGCEQFTMTIVTLGEIIN